MTLDICICPVYTNLVKLLPDPLEFDWDKGNTEKNKLKHSVEPEEIEAIFRR